MGDFMNRGKNLGTGFKNRGPVIEGGSFTNRGAEDQPGREFKNRGQAWFGGEFTNKGPRLLESSTWSPVDLFASGEVGAVFDIADISKVYQDTNGTTAVTAVGQDLKYVTDLSGNAKPQIYNAGTIHWSGWPTAIGSALNLSPEFESTGDWTAGTDWSLSVGTATKTAGTAAALSQSVTLTAGKPYLVHMCVKTRTAGTIVQRFTGGTTVQAEATYSAAGDYFDVIVAATGNNTLEAYADAAFAGTVTIMGVYEVTAMSNKGATFYNNGRLRTAAMDMSGGNQMTIIVAGKSGQRTAARYLAQVANAATTGARMTLSQSGNFGVIVGDAASGAITETSGTEQTLHTYLKGGFVHTGIFDSTEAAAEDQAVVRVNGMQVAETTTGGPIASPQALNATSYFSLGSWLNNNTFYAGIINRAIAINRRLTPTELEQAENWCRSGSVYAGFVGDSTWEEAGPPDGAGIIYSTGTAGLIGGAIGVVDISDWGDSTTEQQTDWDAVSADDKSRCEVVVVSVGHNDVKGRVDSGASLATILADYQTLIDTIRADVPASCKIVAVQLLPCKVWLDTATNPANCYAAWQGWNAALANGDITGLDGVVSSHVATLNNGSDALKTIYNPQGDGIHPGTLGRWVVAQAVRAKLVQLGLVD